MDNDVMTHLTLASVVVMILEGAKNSPRLSFISKHSDKVNRALSGVMAVAIGFGITVMGDRSTGWTITVPPLEVIFQHSWEAFAQFMLQEMMYRGAIKPKTPRVVDDEPLPPTGPRAPLPGASPQ